MQKIRLKLQSAINEIFLSQGLHNSAVLIDNDNFIFYDKVYTNYHYYVDLKTTVLR